MARYTSDHKAQSRETILEAASQLFRSNGYLATGVDTVMRKAGLTAGAFYAHFDSKAALFGETLKRARGATREKLLAGLDELPREQWFPAVVRRYLSSAHRDRREEGCALPAIVSELPHAAPEAQEVFDEYLEKIIEDWAEKTPSSRQFPARERALGTFCLMVGGMTMARAAKSRELSDRILKACRKLALLDVERGR